jgi:hypothetical protein
MEGTGIEPVTSGLQSCANASAAPPSADDSALTAKRLAAPCGGPAHGGTARKADACRTLQLSSSMAYYPRRGPQFDNWEVAGRYGGRRSRGSFLGAINNVSDCAVGRGRVVDRSQVRSNNESPVTPEVTSSRPVLPSCNAP